jgi:hypothetical protein
MPALPGPPDAPSKPRRALGTAGVTLSVLLAVGVVALFLTLLGPAHTGHSDPPDIYRVRTNPWSATAMGAPSHGSTPAGGEPGALATSAQETHRRVREPHISPRARTCFHALRAAPPARASE